MRPHVSPIIVNGWLRHARREIEVEIEEANEVFDRATASEAGWRLFWLSCERRFQGVAFELASGASRFEFKDGWVRELHAQPQTKGTVE